MQLQQFQDILQSIPAMSPEQICVLHKTLPPSPKSDEEQEASGQSRLLERLKYYFDQHPVCPHCHSESIKSWGIHSGHQRYRCKQCLRTFFRESHKGQRHLEVPARKRGGKTSRKKRSGSQDGSVVPVKKIPVMVACDRDYHVVNAVLKHVSTEELTSHLSGRIQAGSTICLDGHMSYDSLTEKLNVTVKTLVTHAGQYVEEGIFHIQTVNAYHSELERWINGFFNGIATKYLPRYLGCMKAIHAFKKASFAFLMATSVLIVSLNAGAIAIQGSEFTILEAYVLANTVLTLKPLIADYLTDYKYLIYPGMLSAHNGQEKKQKDGKKPTEDPSGASHSEGDHAHSADQPNSGATASGGQDNRDDDEPVKRKPVQNVGASDELAIQLILEEIKTVLDRNQWSLNREQYFMMVILSWLKTQLDIAEYRSLLVHLGIHPRYFQSDARIHQMVAFRLINSRSFLTHFMCFLKRYNYTTLAALSQHIDSSVEAAASFNSGIQDLYESPWPPQLTLQSYQSGWTESLRAAFLPSASLEDDIEQLIRKKLIKKLKKLKKLRQRIAQIQSQGLNLSLLLFMLPSFEHIQHLSFVLSAAQQVVAETTVITPINFYYLPNHPEQALQLMMTTYLNMGGSIVALMIALEYCLLPAQFQTFLVDLDHSTSLAAPVGVEPLYSGSPTLFTEQNEPPSDLEADAYISMQSASDTYEDIRRQDQ